MFKKRINWKPIAFCFASNIGSESTCKVHCIATIVENYLWRIGVFSFFDGCKLLSKRCYLRVIIKETGHNSLYLALLNKWFVALNIDHNIEVSAYFCQCFSYAVGATLVVWTCHYCLCTQRNHGIVDSFIVGSNVNIAEYGANLLYNALYYILSTQLSEGFTRETRGRIAGWDNSYYFHYIYVLFSVSCI